MNNQHLKQNILKQIINKNYIGTWKSIYSDTIKNRYKIGKKIEGKILFLFDKAIEYPSKELSLAIIFQAFEENYIDNWLMINSFSKIKDLEISIDGKENKIYLFQKKFFTRSENGKIFDLIGETFKKCYTKINMSFPIKNNNEIIDDNNFNVSYDSECGFNFDIKLKKMENEFDNKNKQISKYCYFSIIECILYYIFTTFINCEINKHEYLNNSICVYFLMINILWHSYNTISNINFGLKFANYILNFFLISLFHLFSFAIFDLRLIYTFWKLKLHQISQREYLKQKVKYNEKFNTKNESKTNSYIAAFNYLSDYMEENKNEEINNCRVLKIGR